MQPACSTPATGSPQPLPPPSPPPTRRGGWKTGPGKSPRKHQRVQSCALPATAEALSPQVQSRPLQYHPKEEERGRGGESGGLHSLRNVPTATSSRRAAPSRKTTSPSEPPTAPPPAYLAPRSSAPIPHRSDVWAPLPETGNTLYPSPPGHMKPLMPMPLVSSHIHAPVYTHNAPHCQFHSFLPSFP